MSYEWDEDTVLSVVQSCVANSLVSLHTDTKSVADQVSYLCESLTAEVLDWGASASIPESESDVLKRLERAGITGILQDLSAEDDDMEYLMEGMLNSLNELSFEEDEGEDLDDGECELCERFIPITRHHVHPKMVHDWCMKHLGKTKRELHITIGICRPCHNAVHRLADHKGLAEFYNTRERLLDAPEILKFATWARKQKVKGVK